MRNYAPEFDAAGSNLIRSMRWPKPSSASERRHRMHELELVVVEPSA